MMVVSNTTPILSLYKINRLDLLQELFGNVYVPAAVYDEIAIMGKDKLGNELFENFDFIKVKQVQNTFAAGLLKSQLDCGETEAIVLAKELDANILILDEKKARRIAQANGQRIIGTIGILQIAKNKGLISSARHSNFVTSP